MESIKVLWFTNTPSLAGGKFKTSSMTGGWIFSLENAIREESDIELGVAFYGKKALLKSDDKNKYFPIEGNNQFFGKLINKIQHINFREEDVEDYLSVINEYVPDIIHIFGTEIPWGRIIRYVKIPVIISIQGNITVIIHKCFSGLPKSFIQKNLNLKDRLLFRDIISSYKTGKKYSIIEQEIFSNCKYFTGRTDWDRRISKVFAPHSVYFHLDEMLRNIFYETKWDNQLNETLKVVSTISEPFYKGLETIFEALNIFNTKRKDINIEWHIVGITENSIIPRMLKKKYHLYESLKNKIVYHGKLHEQYLIDVLLKSNIYVQTSHIENSPNSLCEAMMLGIPIIATYAGGTSSLLTDKKEGILIQDGDPYSLAGTIIELCENYNIAKEYGKHARERAIERHDKTKIVNDLREIYNSVFNSY